MEHEENMAGNEFVNRFISLHNDVKREYEDLKKRCNEIEASEISGFGGPDHACPLELLRKQQSAMGQLLHILEVRAIIEDIKF